MFKNLLTDSTSSCRCINWEAAINYFTATDIEVKTSRESKETDGGNDLKQGGERAKEEVTKTYTDMKRGTIL